MQVVITFEKIMENKRRRDQDSFYSQVGYELTDAMNGKFKFLVRKSGQELGCNINIS